ncbi:conserved hypothetical protein [Arthrobacter sp. Hiyo4]|nr:conserved hypothetical protein [Arthrobacter sp. Hiyo4]
MFQPSRRLLTLSSAFTLLLTMSTVASCAAPDAGQAQPNSTGTSEPASPSESPTATSQAPELCGPGSAVKFDKTAFQGSPTIDNKWFPLKPGTTYTTTGTVAAEDDTTDRTVTHTVTGLTKVIDGVKTLVMWDRDYQDGRWLNRSWPSLPRITLERFGSSASIPRSSKTTNLLGRRILSSTGFRGAKPELQCKRSHGPARRNMFRLMRHQWGSSIARVPTRTTLRYASHRLLRRRAGD